MVSAVLTTHRCPKCASEVVVFARDAQVYHKCVKASLREKMTRFDVVVTESQRKLSRSPARDNGTAR